MKGAQIWDLTSTSLLTETTEPQPTEAKNAQGTNTLISLQCPFTLGTHEQGWCELQMPSSPTLPPSCMFFFREKHLLLQAQMTRNLNLSFTQFFSLWTCLAIFFLCPIKVPFLSACAVGCLRWHCCVSLVLVSSHISTPCTFVLGQECSTQNHYCYLAAQRLPSTFEAQDEISLSSSATINGSVYHVGSQKKKYLKMSF